MTTSGPALRQNRASRRVAGARCTTALLLSTALVALPAGLGAQDLLPGQTPPQVPSHNTYGLPGLVDMPSAIASPDATLSATHAQLGDTRRTTLSFQIAPRLVGSFRYSGVSNFPLPGAVDGEYYDRSFDLRYQILKEGRYRPAVAVGLQDFIGTGLYGGEYLVASKTILPGLQVTGGLGWGRLGSYNAIATTGDRPAELLGEGGVPTYDRWFRGDVAPFGGISYAVNDRLTFTAEYSSDAYDREDRIGDFDRASPWNFGVDYRFRNGTQLSLYHAYGSEIGAQITVSTNPKHASVPGGSELAPAPIAPRSAADRADLGWTDQPGVVRGARVSVGRLLEREGLTVEGLRIEPRRATIRLLNPTYWPTAQAIGRTARVMTRSLPASIEEFVIVPVVNGMPLSAVTLQRSDLEALENEAAVDMLARAQVLDAYGRSIPPEAGIYPKFTWSISPYTAFSAFDPQNPIRIDGGIRASAEYRITPGLVLSGSVTKKLLGNIDEIDREPDTALPAVRTDFARYSAEGDPALAYLTLAHYGRPAPNLYSRVTLGYLERMYAGASAELLWKPAGSKLALGAEVNYVRARDYDLGFGLRSNTTATGEIPELNGHLSAYYAFGNGFHGQLDVGRYLAGDYGATVTLDREFGNGWRVGAYATFTDTSFEDFGEGSFDKGIRVTIPLGWAIGTPSRTRNTLSIASLTRDGGAKLRVRDRLYDQVRDYHAPDLANSWGRFWR